MGSEGVQGSVGGGVMLFYAVIYRTVNAEGTLYGTRRTELQLPILLQNIIL